MSRTKVVKSKVVVLLMCCFMLLLFQEEKERERELSIYQKLFLYSQFANTPVLSGPSF